MTLEKKTADQTSRPTITLDHAAKDSMSPSASHSSLSANLLDDLVMTPSFRLRDLPEELQRHCIGFCLPQEWHIRASLPMRIACPETGNSYIYGLRHVPPIPARLYLVDKQTFHQAQAASLKSFTGELYLASVIDKAGWKTYSQYGLGQEMTSGRLDTYRNSITIVHVGSYQHVQGFGTFDSNLITVLPRLQMVVAHSEKRLHEESLYGWGDANHLISILADKPLIDFMQRESERRDIQKSDAAIEVIWNAGLKTLLEMKIIMGSGEMTVSFYCIFWLRKDEDVVVLGKYPVNEWLGSSTFRRSVYEKAV